MYEAIISTIFGAADAIDVHEFPSMQLAASQQALALQNWRPRTRRLEAGIFWTQTGGKTHRVIIRRELEFVDDSYWLGHD